MTEATGGEGEVLVSPSPYSSPSRGEERGKGMDSRLHGNDAFLVTTVTLITDNGMEFKVI
jgi:hypothetical protein